MIITNNNKWKLKTMIKYQNLDLYTVQEQPITINFSQKMIYTTNYSKQ